MVGPARLELATSGPPARRTTNCAIARLRIKLSGLGAGGLSVLR